jgi:hypothetical protein
MKKVSLRLLFCLAITAISLFSTINTVTFNNAVAAQGAKQPDKRKQTTLQTVTVDVDKKSKAVEILYLNMPWGEKTFSYLEQGGNQYYSTRTWPFAHLKLSTAAKYDGKNLAPGNYVLILTPKSEKDKTELTLSMASFTPDKNGTFLVPGDVFTETPEGIVEVTKKPIKFAKGAPMVDHLEINLEKESAKAVAIKIHYGDRTLTEKLELN